MKSLIDGHAYELDNGQLIVFPHRDERGGMIFDKTTTTGELLDLLTHRIRALNEEHYCEENIKTIAHLVMAQKHQKNRKQRQSSNQHQLENSHV